MNYPKNDRPRLFWFAQSAPPSVLSRGRTDPAKLIDSVHMLRDGASALYITQLLKDRYEFRDVLLNLSPTTFDRKVAPLEVEKFRSGDLILMVTRPPIDDDRENGRRPIHRTGSGLEAILLDTLRKILLCDRQYVILTDRVAARIPSGQVRLYRAVRFHVHSNAYICDKADCCNPVDLKQRGDQEEATIGYLLHVPCVCSHQGRKGPRLLLVFGLNGTATLIFSHLLRSKYPNLVQEAIDSEHSRLVMIKFAPHLDAHRLPVSIGSIDISQDKVVLDVSGEF